jgi:hypothetical protein
MVASTFWCDCIIAEPNDGFIGNQIPFRPFLIFGCTQQGFLAYGRVYFNISQMKISSRKDAAGDTLIDTVVKLAKSSGFRQIR